MSDLRTVRFAIIGAGNIGRILISRLLALGVPPENLVVNDRDHERVSAVASQFVIKPISLSEEVVRTSDVILLAAPPKSVLDLLTIMSNWFRAGQLVISFAAAVPLAKLESMLPTEVMVVRVMPNAPSLVGQGMNPVAYGNWVTPEGKAVVEAILACLGETIPVSDDQMNWCVGLSGAAMRSLLPVLEGMIEAGIEAGFTAQNARKIAAQVMLGTASLVLQTDLSFEEIKALTPMQTVNDTEVANIFLQAARSAREKIDQAQAKLMET